MKILNIIAQKPSSTGSGIYLSELMKSFDRLGAVQALICADDKNEVNLYEFKESIKDLKIYPLYFNSEEMPFDIFGMSDVMPYKSRRYRDMTSLELEVYEKTFVRLMEMALSEFKPDLVICHHLYLAAALFIENFGGEKLGLVCHGTDLRQLYTNKLERNRIIKTLGGAKQIFALQDEQKNDIASLFKLSLNDIKVIGNGFNSEVFYLGDNDHSDFDQDLIRLAYAGKISKAKGLVALLNAINKIKDYKIELNLAGNPSDIEEYWEIKNKAEESLHRVNFLGQMNHKELAEFFNRSDIFVLPSYYEGLALVCIEAAACGLPVVVTNTSGIKRHINEKLDDHHFVFIDLPKMLDPDRPVEADLPDFEDRLAGGILEQIELLRGGKINRGYLKGEDFSWDNVAKNILDEFREGGLQW